MGQTKRHYDRRNLPPMILSEIRELIYVAYCALLYGEEGLSEAALRQAQRLSHASPVRVSMWREKIRQRVIQEAARAA